MNKRVVIASIKYIKKQNFQTCSFDVAQRANVIKSQRLTRNDSCVMGEITFFPGDEKKNYIKKKDERVKYE